MTEGELWYVTEYLKGIKYIFVEIENLNVNIINRVGLQVHKGLKLEKISSSYIYFHEKTFFKILMLCSVTHSVC
jgi:hypothetical protein